MALGRRRRARPLLTSVTPGVGLPEPSALELSRRAWRQRRARRSTLVALASAPCCSRWSATWWSPARRAGRGCRPRSSRPGVAWESLPEIARRAVAQPPGAADRAALLVLVVGLLVALTRTLRGPAFAPLRIVAAIYVDLFRGMPLIIVLYLVGFGVPGLRLQGVPDVAADPGDGGARADLPAYVAEVFRAGIESVHPSQRAAARSLGLTTGRPCGRGAPAGRAHGHPAAAQRLRRAAEGRRTDLRARRGRRRPGGADPGRADASTSRRTSWPGLLFVLLAVPVGAAGRLR